LLPTPDEQKTVEISSVVPNATSQLGSKPSIFGPSIFGSSLSLNNTGGGYSFPNFGTTATASSPAFQFSLPTRTATVNKPSTFSFGSAASSTNTSTTGNDNDEEADEPHEPNFQFRSIVHLSPVITKTGEEDENVLFCEHAKLYRFDSRSNQMKERGTGEMKILQHKTTNLCRILMRREKVLNLCANHQLTSQMELEPHQRTENAYIWSAMDFADGEVKHEVLCIRFKSSNTAKKFVKQFNEAKQGNAKC
jgi:hypothetical protein